MKNTNKMTKVLCLLTLAVGIWACSSAPTTQEFATTASPAEEVGKFESEMVVAATNQVNVLSPSNFKQAAEYLKDAKRSLDKQNSPKDTLHEVAQGRAYMNRSLAFAKLAHENIDDVIVSRGQALAAGVQKFRNSEFEAADEKLTDVTSEIEKNNISEATKNRSTLQLTYLDLELQSIKQGRLGAAREKIEQAKKNGAEKFAPRTLAIAEKSFRDTDAFITGNRHDAQIPALAEETVKSADHLLKITNDSKSDKKTSSEDTALQLEDEKNKIAVKQGQIQSNEVELAQKERQVTKGENANQALTAENSVLESKDAANQRYEEARAQFSNGEAEVYKQGNTLLIRLRGLEFPTAQSGLKGSNFPLLAKVQKVIKSFGESSVVIEGHTDSVGGEILNQKLSTDRAEAVREYLSSNNTGKALNIKAVGYGYQKPLATNKTANGRAQNRRVDVLIQPEVNQEPMAN